jgi:peptidoglycan hydrolase-like protein with peptidoglycan-binding domain
VAVLQQLLSDIGYFEGGIDGYFGATTKSALLEMDEDYGEIVSINISPIGALGNTTIAEVEELVMTARRKLEEDLPDANLGYGSKGKDVLNLQKSLKRLGYALDLTEIFDDLTQEALIEFQIKEGVIDSRDHVAAGYFGAQTQLKLVEALKESLPDEVGVTIDDESYSFLPNNEKFERSMKLGETSEDVRKLQEVLRRMSLFRIEPTGYFGPVTQHAVIKMQLKYNLIDRVSDVGAGTVGPSTQRLLNRFQNQYLKRLNTELKPYDAENNKLFESELSLGDNSKDVFVLQKFLQEQGYLNSVLLTKFYGDQTFEAMAQYKLDNNLIENISVKNAGNLDKSTIDYINSSFK